MTRPGGRIVIVDYELPRERVARWLVYRVVKLWERDNFAEFVKADLRAMLDAAGMEVVADTSQDIRWWRPFVAVLARKRP